MQLCSLFATFTTDHAVLTRVSAVAAGSTGHAACLQHVQSSLQPSRVWAASAAADVEQHASKCPVGAGARLSARRQPSVDRRPQQLRLADVLASHTVGLGISAGKASMHHAC